MRLLTTTALCGISVALLVGCSNFSKESLPNSGAMSPLGLGVSQYQEMPLSENGPMTPTKLLQWEAQGKVPSPMRREAAERTYKYLLGHPRMQVRANSIGPVALWLTNEAYGYLLGTNAKGAALETAVNVGADGCGDPVTVHTDESKNVWVDCSEGPTHTGGAEQEYSMNGSGPKSTFNVSAAGGCPPSSSCNSGSYDGGYDASTGTVFVEQSFASAYVCPTSGCFYESLSPGVFVYKAKHPELPPTFLELSSYGDPASSMYFAAPDGQGNLYFDYEGYQNSAFGFGIGEITNYTKPSAAVNFILPVGTLTFAGGVQVVNGKLYVTDQGSFCSGAGGTTAEYALPLTPSSMPIATYGPTLADLNGCGDPTSGGFNSAATKQVQGDAYGWSDLTNTNTNVSAATWNIDDLPSVPGAAYAASGQP